MNKIISLLTNVWHLITGKPKGTTQKILKPEDQKSPPISTGSSPDKKGDRNTETSKNGKETTTSSTDSASTQKNETQRSRVSKKPFITSITGALNESLLSTRKLVNYEPSNKFKQTVPPSFPLVLMPAKNTVIKPPVNGKTSNKGMTEESFCRDFLMRYFKDQVFDSLTVFMGLTPYEPDLAFIDSTSGKNIFIDIEIDEPYDGISRKPTHYLTQNGTFDDNRNKGFTDRGWMVIRFAEEQIVKYPNECARFIGEVINSVNPLFTSTCLDFPGSLKSISMWTDAEARAFAAAKKREKYLGISEFFASGGTRDYKIMDSNLGKEIEETINQNKVVESSRLGRIKIASQPINPASAVPTEPEEQKEAINPAPMAIKFPSSATPTLAKLIPPAIVVSGAKLEEPRLTTKTPNPSQPSPQPYAN